MKGLIFGFVTILLAFNVQAQPDKDTANKKPVDTSKYCYYDSVEYSAGAIIKQAKGLKQCVRKENSNDLVWVKYNQTQL